MQYFLCIEWIVWSSEFFWMLLPLQGDEKIKNNNFASCAVKTNNFGWFFWTLWTSFEPFFLIFLFLIFSESSKSSRRVFAWRGFSSSAIKMASSSGGALKDLVHPNFNEALKTHNSVSFKLVKTGEL